MQQNVSMVAMKIAVINQQKDMKVSAKQVKAVVKEVIAFEGNRCDEVAIHFVKTKEICRLHDEFFNDPTTTDCITFPMDDPSSEGYCYLGEVFVCPETAVNYCQKHGGDASIEMILYVVHGLLHLMGYRDHTPAEKRKMRRAEKRHMEHLAEKELIGKLQD
jgi:probable rRNA maturation factor